MTVYARWAQNEEMKQLLSAVSKENEVKTSGLPVMYDDKNLYIDGRCNHSLVIGSTGSGKTQSITLPMLELSKSAGESVVVHDSRNELYDTTSKEFKESGYNVIKINFDDPKNSDYWNPFDLVTRIYKENNFDKAQQLIEDIGYYLLYEEQNKNTDSFWNNSAINYFTGIILYMLDNNIELNLNKINQTNLLVQEKSSEFLKNIDKNSNVYTNLRGILNAPQETKGSIFSVFDQKINKYISKQNLTNMMSKSDFDIEGIAKKKTIIYVVSGNTNNSEYLLPLLISQLYSAKENITAKNCIRVIIDDFHILNPIKNFSKILSSSRGINMPFTIIIRGFNDLRNTYGVEMSEIIKISFTNILYLLSKDLNTLKEISDLCGDASNNGKQEPLITIEELKTLKMFEAIYLTLRMMPFKTKLIPYYKIDK